MPLIYLLFFASGAAALAYQVAWVRSLSLVFGGTHLAVTTVLSVFMGGLALGSAVLGRRADRSERPLRLYGLIEIGIAVSAVAFLGLMRAFPHLYAPVARAAGGNPLVLSAVRIAFGAVAIIVPTALMGGTLPVLARFASTRQAVVGRRLALLYAVNTAGAVAGTLLVGFVLLERIGVQATILAAAALNALVGLAAIAAAGRSRAPATVGEPAPPPPDAVPVEAENRVGGATVRIVLWGTAISGFCALGYEVLWTRALTLVVGTSTYSFTIILAVFLAGIGLGSQAFGLAHRWHPRRQDRAVLLFGLAQLGIGLLAAVITFRMADLPEDAVALLARFSDESRSDFGSRQVATFAVASAYMLAPAFLSGVSFPLAAMIVAREGGAVGISVGRALSWNTVGSILGAAVTGFLLVPLFGIERALQLLAVANLGLGAVAVASLARRRAVRLAPAVAAGAVLVVLVSAPGLGRFWDPRAFATFQNSFNARDRLRTPEERRAAIEGVEVLYYFEGINETISALRTRGGALAFRVNGRTEATTDLGDVQLQRALGHLPLLLHPDPRSVFVLGSGAGMTLGSTTVHPTVERVVLAEIEPGVFPATRAFADWNHRALDNPKVEVFLNDGRNHLAVTDERFDVITSDPIHPWSGGAAYLYTEEYFRTVASRLRPGGIAAHWLPLYELSRDDVRSIVKTFASAFPHVAVWKSLWDATLIGSDAPIVVDAELVAQRLGLPQIAGDLRPVGIGTVDDLLAGFALGDAGVRAYVAGATVNTDDNLSLEFSAPRSMGVWTRIGDNVDEIAKHRESVLPHVRVRDPEASRQDLERWARLDATGRTYDVAHAETLWFRHQGSKNLEAMARLENDAPGYGPYRMLLRLLKMESERPPRLLGQVSLPVALEGGRPAPLVVSALASPAGDGRTVIEFVDFARMRSFGQRVVAGSDRDARARDEASRVLARVRAGHEALVQAGAGAGFPPEPRVEAITRAAVAGAPAN